MPNRQPAEPDAKVLPKPVAERLLARASELDAVRAAGSEVAELRAAAVEAGISAHAFDAALAEMRDAEEEKVPAVTAPPPRRFRMGFLGAVVAFVVLTGMFVVMRLVAPVRAAPGAAMVEESIVLRCLSTSEAVALVRPLLGDRLSTVAVPPGEGSRVLTIRTTPAQLQEVQALLDKSDAAGSPACAVRPPTKVTP